MNLKTATLTIIVAIASIFSAQAVQPAKSAHARAHESSRRHIAKQSDPLDASRLSNFIENEIEAREEKAAAVSAQTNRLVDDLLTEARRHMGKPYVHGSKGPKSFDCSGFSSYVFKQFGFKLSPASRMQATQGQPVAKGDLRKGDLVFFTSRSSGGAVGHVGIVVSADNSTGKFKFIHASIKGVKISENEGYYKSRYLFARRVIN